MHELSIVEALINQCENIAKENNAKKVLNVHVKIGVLSGIEVHFLKITFDTFKEKTICDGAFLHVKIQKIKFTCKNCNEQNILEKNVFICPKCQSTDLQIDDGEDMMLMSLEME